jgi:multidrug transporter EmrE-like cation transporter
MNLSTFVLIIVSVSLNALAQVVLRKAMLTASSLPPVSQPLHLGLALAGNVWLLAGMACYAASIGLWLVVLARVQVSIAYPMLSIGYIIAAVLGFMFLGESVGVARVIGIALICGGVVLVARSA